MYFILVVFAILGGDGKPVDGLHLATAKTQFANIELCKKELPKVVGTLIPILKKKFPDKKVESKAACVTEQELASVYGMVNGSGAGPKQPTAKTPEQQKQDEHNKI
jgi:hypothetical protein